MDVVEVLLSWDATVLAVEHVKAGCALALGERGDMLLPAEILGDDRVELVRFDGELASISVPAGARLRVDGFDRGDDALILEVGSLVEITIGPFALKLARVPEERCRPAPPLDGLRRSGAGFIAGSALLHAAVFAAVALFAPSLGATEEDPFDADRMALLQRMLDASAQREAEHPPEAALSAAGGGEASGGQPAPGAEGAAGRPDTDKSGRWAAKGTAKPQDASLAREHELLEAQTFGAIGVLSSVLANDPNAPVVPWGTVANGSDDVSRIGRLFGDTIDDGHGTGGLGLHGPGEGGGGTANGIGLDGFGFGHTADGCNGPSPCDGIGGIGHGSGRGSRGRVSHFKGPRYPPPEVNGRLAAEVIRRIVRMNDGRYRACYESGLRTDPGLQGRVTVKFVIDRTGAVALAADGGSDIPDEAVRRCVVSSFLSLSFPSPESGSVTVVYPIVFSPE
jgi:hypothetical protein